MVKLNIHQAKTHLSRYLELLKGGEYIVLCNRNVPVAEIRGLPSEQKESRKFGLSKGEVELGEDFFDPLPDEFLKYFG
jgi:antitoxin (DNA-binding transcriptional repressor) of toxin-antitoxin stability system